MISAYLPEPGETRDGDYVRKVYVVSEGGSIPDAVLCEDCVRETSDEAYTRSCIIRRGDTLHCIGCDYHADPECGPWDWCGVVAYERIGDR